MIRAFLIVLLAATLAFGGTPPKPPAPDPFGTGYMGIYPGTGEEDLRVREVTPGSPAQNAGVRAGDRLLQAGEFEPKQFTELRDFIGGLRPGTKVPLFVQRGDAKIRLVVTLGERPTEARTAYPVDPNE
jgi:S1-C subfamily serine protease